jgi:hypothetical protein
VILSTTLSGKFSLADIAALGLMLLALQALHLSSQQVGEWRRKDAKSTCTEIEEKFYIVANEIVKLAFAAKKIKAGEVSHYELGNKIKPHDVIYLLNKLKYIDTHLSALEKRNITPAIDLIKSYLNTIMILPDRGFKEAYKSGKEFSISVNNFLDSINEFESYLNASEVYSIPHLASSVRILHFYEYLLNYCIKK